MSDPVPNESASTDNSTAVTAASLSGNIAEFIAAGGNLGDLTLPQTTNVNDSNPPPPPPPVHQSIPKPLKDAPPVFQGNPERFFEWLAEFASFAGLHDFASALQTENQVPVGQMVRRGVIVTDDELIQRGFSRIDVRRARNAWRALERASKDRTLKSVLNRHTTPSEAYRGLIEHYERETRDRVVKLDTELHNKKLAPGQLPSALWDVTLEGQAILTAAGKPMDDDILFANFLKALPSSYELEVRPAKKNWSMSREDILSALRMRFHELQGGKPSRNKEGQATAASAKASKVGASGSGRRDAKGGEDADVSGDDIVTYLWEMRKTGARQGGMPQA